MHIKKSTHLLFVVVLAASLPFISSYRYPRFTSAIKPDTHEAVISFRLKKHQKCIFDYTTSCFEPKRILFSNPNDHDTTVSKDIFLDAPIDLSFNLLIPQPDNEIKTIKYALLISPGDKVSLSLTNEGYLNTRSCKIFSILSDSSTEYYTDQMFRSSGPIDGLNEKWKSFTFAFNQKHDEELIRIGNLIKDAKIDSNFYNQLIFNCDLHYYKRLLDWVFERDNKYFKPALDMVSSQLPNIEQLLNNRSAFLSNELLDVIDGVVRAKIIKAGKDYSNYYNIYAEAEKSNLGQFKPGYLAVCIYKSPVKLGDSFKNMVKEYSGNYNGTNYSRFIDSILKNGHEGKPMLTNDQLVESDGATTSWNNVVNSKKGKLIIVDFWASWCVPCRQQLPLMDSLRDIFKKYDIEIISVNLDKNLKDWKMASVAEKRFLKENNYHLESPEKSNLVRDLQIAAIPRYVVLGNQKIVANDFFQPTEQGFVNEIIKLSHLGIQ